MPFIRLFVPPPAPIIPPVLAGGDGAKEQTGGRVPSSLHVAGY